LIFSPLNYCTLSCWPARSLTIPRAPHVNYKSFLHLAPSPGSSRCRGYGYSRRRLTGIINPRRLVKRVNKSKPYCWIRPTTTRFRRNLCKLANSNTVVKAAKRTQRKVNLSVVVLLILVHTTQDLFVNIIMCGQGSSNKSPRYEEARKQYEGWNRAEAKRNTEGGKQNASLNKAKKDKLVGATGKNVRTETSMVSVTLRVKPELTLPATYVFLRWFNCFTLFSVKLIKLDMCEYEKSLILYISDEGKRTYTLFQGHSGPVYSAAFSPFGDFLLSSSSDLTIRLWSTKLNANLVCYKGHNYPVWDVQFSPVGHYFASASHDRTARICDKTVRLWDVQTGECIRMFIGHRSMVLSLAMSPDGRYMASGDEDGTIMIWDLSTGRCVSPLLGHNSCVWTLAFSCEGALLESGSADCTVKLWDVAFSTKALRTEDTKGSSSANRLRLLKSLPTKSAPVYSLR
ncbi:hypothetical protein ACJX0J_025398, partial [Zea mays]